MTVDQVAKWAKAVAAIAAALAVFAGLVRAYDAANEVEDLVSTVEAINLNVRDLLMADCQRRGVPPLECLPRPEGP